ncbi:MAG: penicillin-binding protein activator LpoB [Candidatus Cloacimonetes bacterium]|nr:penicillin-binding protein activator LpoB [Candidatus Cloacimonadota bacterium]
MKRFVLFTFVLAFVLAGCGANRTVTRTAVDETIDISGRWNDVDSREVANQIVTDVLARPWLSDYMMASGEKPVVVVGPVRNKSSEHISIEAFVNDIERELVNSGKIRFVAGDDMRNALSAEIMHQQTNASEETVKRLASQTGADFMLMGTLLSIEDKADGRKVMYYQADMELINIETHEKVWMGTKKIKKLIEQSGARW